MQNSPTNNTIRKDTELESDSPNYARPESALTEQINPFLTGVFDQLPFSVTVQDEGGNFVVVNETAAANLGMSVQALTGASPADFLPESEAAMRREWEQRLFKQKRAVTIETDIVQSDGTHSWLTTYRPTRILNRDLLITSAFDVTWYKQAERQLAERVHIDDLTNLPDRSHIQHHVEAAIQGDDGTLCFALAFIDLDNFKHINDYYSHAIGDSLLVKVSQRISARISATSLLARISGDEFLLMLKPFESKVQIQSIISEILDDLRQPFHIEGFEIFSSCSIGISFYPEHGRSYETLRRHADGAMYRAKHMAKGSAIFFDTSMAQAVTARMEAEQRLRLAIRDRKFCCAFQPKVDIYTHQVVGFETLVRWVDEAGEIHPPSEFVGLAIELGLINAITTNVLNEVTNSIDRLDAAFGSDTAISVNIAAKQANDLNFMQALTEHLKESKYSNRIILELTEEAFIAKGQFQTLCLPALRNLGVRVSIDDFGTGYSSLSVLADITADEIKIDRSLITEIHRRPRNQSVLRAIESLCQALDMPVVAEGVESHEEITYLLAATRIRCVQGYYFSRPFYLEDLNRVPSVLNRSLKKGQGPADQGIGVGRHMLTSRGGK